MLIKNNHALRTLAVACGLAMASVAHAGVEGNIGYSSDYLWRGVTQTGHGASVFGGADYSHDVGVYAGTWTSNIAGDTEIDVYGGYSNEFGGVGIDLGYIYYHYPHGAENFGEAYVGLSYSVASVTYYADTENENSYVTGGVSFDVKGISVGANVGSYMMKDSADDYMNYDLSFSKSTDAGDFSLMVSDTDLEAGPDEEPTVVVSYSTAFEIF